MMTWFWHSNWLCHRDHYMFAANDSQQIACRNCHYFWICDQSNTAPLKFHMGKKLLFLYSLVNIWISTQIFTFPCKYWARKVDKNVYFCMGMHIFTSDHKYFQGNIKYKRYAFVDNCTNIIKVTFIQNKYFPI